MGVQALAVVARSCLQPQPSDRPAFSMLLRSLQLCDWPHNSGSSASGSTRCERLGTDNTGVSTNTNSHASTVPHDTSMATSQEDVVFGVGGSEIAGGSSASSSSGSAVPTSAAAGSLIASPPTSFPPVVEGEVSTELQATSSSATSSEDQLQP